MRRLPGIAARLAALLASNAEYVGEGIPDAVRTVRDTF